ncbi:hypothetical protein C8R43DRAFT_960214 [Mycena crocata]|nr:hypothetical protein C8R43DRAFT_960214 [Mycena crocata]
MLVSHFLPPFPFAAATIYAKDDGELSPKQLQRITGDRNYSKFVRAIFKGVRANRPAQTVIIAPWSGYCPFGQPGAACGGLRIKDGFWVPAQSPHDRDSLLQHLAEMHPTCCTLIMKLDLPGVRDAATFDLGRLEASLSTNFKISRAVFAFAPTPPSSEPIPWADAVASIYHRALLSREYAADKIIPELKSLSSVSLPPDFPAFSSTDNSATGNLRILYGRFSLIHVRYLVSRETSLRWLRDQIGLNQPLPGDKATERCDPDDRIPSGERAVSSNEMGDTDIPSRPLILELMFHPTRQDVENERLLGGLPRMKSRGSSEQNGARQETMENRDFDDERQTVDQPGAITGHQTMSTLSTLTPLSSETSERGVSPTPTTAPTTLSTEHNFWNGVELDFDLETFIHAYIEDAPCSHRKKELAHVHCPHAWKVADVFTELVVQLQEGGFFNGSLTTVADSAAISDEVISKWRDIETQGEFLRYMLWLHCHLGCSASPRCRDCHKVQKQTIINLGLMNSSIQESPPLKHCGIGTVHAYMSACPHARTSPSVVHPAFEHRRGVTHPTIRQAGILGFYDSTGMSQENTLQRGIVFIASAMQELLLGLIFGLFMYGLITRVQSHLQEKFLVGLLVLCNIAESALDILVAWDTLVEETNPLITSRQTLIARLEPGFTTVVVFLVHGFFINRCRLVLRTWTIVVVLMTLITGLIVANWSPSPHNNLKSPNQKHVLLVIWLLALNIRLASHVYDVSGFKLWVFFARK